MAPTLSCGYDDRVKAKQPTATSSSVCAFDCVPLKNFVSRHVDCASSHCPLPLASEAPKKIEESQSVCEDYAEHDHPLIGWQSAPITTFMDACQYLQQRNFKAHFEHALVTGMAFATKNPSFLPSLSFDLRCAIPAAVNLYSQEWDDAVYRHLNGLLRSTIRGLLTPYLAFFKLLYLADMTLPHVASGTVVYRGVKKDLTACYPKGQIFRWWGFTSATLTLATLNDPLFCGGEGERTIFNITCRGGGIFMKGLSCVEGEEEVLLKAGSRFIVNGVLSLGPEVSIIQVEEIPDDEDEIDAVICAKKGMHSLSGKPHTHQSISPPPPLTPHPANLASPNSFSSSSLCSPVALQIIRLMNEGKCVEAFGRAKENAHTNGDCTGLLALCYDNGFGTDISLVDRKKLNHLAMDKGTALGCAIACFYQGKYSHSAPLLNRLVEEGVSVAQYMLGYQYENGFGVVKDVNKGMELYHKAADQGFAPALKFVGLMYQSGDGVERDIVKAFGYLQSSVHHGSASALTNLAFCYKNGLGVAKDQKKALDLYRQAAAKCERVAEYNLSVAYLHGFLGVGKNESVAVEYLRRAASRGYENAKKRLRELRK